MNFFTNSRWGGTLNISNINFLSDLLTEYFQGEHDSIFKSFMKRTIDYLDFLQHTEKQIKKNKSHKKELQNKLDTKTYGIIRIANSLEMNISLPSVRKRVRELFRNIFGNYIFQSYILKRAYEKPQGYPGDYLLFEKVYDNKPLSDGIGYYFDKCALRHLLNDGVRKRKNVMQGLLEKYINNANDGSLEIMNLGCGSCREIKDFLLRYNLQRKLSFTCVDQDKDALQFAKHNINPGCQNVRMVFVQKNMLDVINLRQGNLSHDGKKKDIIYSLGLCDYFRDTVLENFIKLYYSMLKPNGKLIIAFCSSARPLIYAHLRWFCEWQFFTRDFYAAKSFIRNILQTNRIKTIGDSSSPIFFVIIER